MLAPNTWQPVPGCSQVSIFPILRAPSILCSNSYILDAPDAIVLIDPGADSRQSALILELLSALRSRAPRPVNVFFTHCHIDHIACIPDILASDMDFNITLPERGAQILSKANNRHTCADLFGWSAPQLKADSLMLPLSSSAGDTARLPLGKQAFLEAYYAPGHSQDSVCYRIGELLLVGDLPFAVTPGIAGVMGWSQPQLVESLSFILELFQNGAVSLAASGHGRMLDRDRALRVFQHGLRRAKTLYDLAHINKDRVFELQDLSSVLLDEASRAFAGLGGRLLRLNHYLDELGETEAGQKALEAIDLEGMEKAVHEFSEYARSVKPHSPPDGATGLQMLSKAVQFSDRGQRLLGPLLNRGVFAPRLARRIQRLLIDFVNYAQGVSFEGQDQIVDIREELLSIFQEINEETSASLAAQQAFFDASHDHEAFCALLTKRIGDLSLLNELRVSLVSEPCAAPCWVALETVSFRDLISSTLELYTLAGLRDVQVCLEIQPTTIRLGFRAEALYKIPEAKIAYFQLSLRRLSGSCVRSQEQGMDLVFELPRVREDTH